MIRLSSLAYSPALFHDCPYALAPGEGAPYSVANHTSTISECPNDNSSFTAQISAVFLNENHSQSDLISASTLVEMEIRIV